MVHFFPGAPHIYIYIYIYIYISSRISDFCSPFRTFSQIRHRLNQKGCLAYFFLRLATGGFLTGGFFEMDDLTGGFFVDRWFFL